VNAHLEARPVERRTIAHLLSEAAAERGDDVFFRWDGRATTIGDAERMVNRLARGLRQRGVGDQTRVAVMMGSGPEYLALWFALARVGAVEVPINTAYRGELLQDQLVRARVTMAVVDEANRAAVEEVVPRLPDLRDLVVQGPGAPFAELLHEDDGPLEGSPDPAALACIIYTSGTTGPSKGVLITHHQELSFAAYWAEIVALERGDVVLNYLPYFHIAGKFLTIACLLTGAEMVLVPRLSVERFWIEARAEGITHFIAVGGVCNMLHGRAPQPDDADNPVRVVYAVPAPAEIYEDFERRFGVKLVECYGSTEANLVLHTRLDESAPGSCGRVNPDFEVRIADALGNEVPVGTPGEILVRPRVPLTTMSGYDGMPERTLEAWDGLWFHTGDRARRDADGLHFFLDRMKDSIRRRGENISSFEVERLVGGHPAVSEVAAVGVPSELGEEEVKVVVVARDGARVEPEELLRHCADRMPYFMVPRYVEVVDELARTPTNKVEKYRLREAGITPGTWDCEAAGLRITRRGLEPVARTPA
jgi:crotonobetaine/carnitine-CoA ligase